MKHLYELCFVIVDPLVVNIDSLAGVFLYIFIVVTIYLILLFQDSMEYPLEILPIEINPPGRKLENWH